MHEAHPAYDRHQGHVGFRRTKSRPFVNENRDLPCLSNVGSDNAAQRLFGYFTGRTEFVAAGLDW